MKQKILTDTYLAQRLTHPFVWNTTTKSNELKPVPDSVPIVIKNKICDLKAMQEIRQNFWSYDYMGAAEYEFGAVADAMERFSEKKLVTFSFNVSFDKIELPSVRGYWKRNKGKEVYVDSPPLTTTVKHVTVYVICGEDEDLGARTNIQQIAYGKARVKMGAAFGYAAWTPYSTENQFSIHRDIGGWFEETNAFWFFLDTRMYLGACRMFGVTPVQVP